MVHKIRGKVVRGNSIGRKLGFPTANIHVAAEMPVQDGVYAAEVRVGGALYRAMVNIGTRPT
ncbi:MAG: riboflavin kinase, partial [Tidjanibacter sp.]|nr:riboflavin kinase [Tidjanibacter sp.]